MAALRRFVALLLPLVLGGFLHLPAVAAVAAEAQEDGPYVLWEGREARVLTVREGRLSEARRKAPFALPLPGISERPLHLDGRAPEAARDAWPLPPKVLAVSDIHGAFGAFRRLLQAQGAVDAGGAWRFGRGHLVVVGDCFDRGAEVTELLWFLRGLESQAIKAGGRVHFLLGNHEAMVLRGDLRYLNPKYQALSKGVLPLTMDRLMGPDSELGRWLRSRPALLKLGPLLFVHGGLSPELAAQGLTLPALNARLRQTLSAPGAQAEGAFLLGDEGPLWFRGMIPGALPRQDLDGAQVERLLATFGARCAILGHSTLPRVTAFHGGRVFGIDAGLKGGLPGEAWIWEQGKAWRGLPDGSREALETVP